MFFLNLIFCFGVGGLIDYNESQIRICNEKTNKLSLIKKRKHSLNAGESQFRAKLLIPQAVT